MNLDAEVLVTSLMVVAAVIAVAKVVYDRFFSLYVWVEDGRYPAEDKVDRVYRREPRRRK